jgi:hypothetical protein
MGPQAFFSGFKTQTADEQLPELLRFLGITTLVIHARKRDDNGGV